MAGRKPIPINLKSTSPDDEVRFFKTICEATKELGFSEQGMGKAYHAGRNQIGEYELEWLETPLEPDAEAAPRKRVSPKTAPRTKTGELKRKVNKRMDRLRKENIDEKMVLNCTFCGLPLGREDRSDYISMARLDNDVKLDTIDTFDSMYKASKATGISWNAREKGNTLIIRRKDKVPFDITWSNIHPNCFEAGKEERRLKEREQEIKRRS